MVVFPAAAPRLNANSREKCFTTFSLLRFRDSESSHTGTAVTQTHNLFPFPQKGGWDLVSSLSPRLDERDIEIRMEDKINNHGRRVGGMAESPAALCFPVRCVEPVSSAATSLLLCFERKDRRDEISQHCVCVPSGGGVFVCFDAMATTLPSCKQAPSRGHRSPPESQYDRSPDLLFFQLLLFLLPVSLHDEDEAFLRRLRFLSTVQDSEAVIEVGHAPDSPLGHRRVELLLLHLHAREVVVHLR